MIVVLLKLTQVTQNYSIRQYNKFECLYRNIINMSLPDYKWMNLLKCWITLFRISLL
jgi:hypothetical protein